MDGFFFNLNTKLKRLVSSVCHLELSICLHHRRVMTSTLKNEKKTTVECSACLDKLESTHGGIHCVQGHHLCLDKCSKQFADTILEEPHLLIPVKCPTCKVVLNDDMMQRVMTSEQLEKFQYYFLQIMASKQKHEGEVFCMCPFCKYFEYRLAMEDDIMFIHCQEPTCKKISCFVCRLSVDTDDEDKVDFHFTCSSLRNLKNKFESVLLNGITVPCPNCGLAGMKDDSCSHMHCPGCATDWCYACGKTESNIDKEVENSFYSHFDGWEDNVARCPMYLHYISEINEDYPDDDDTEALAKFHQNRSKMMLKSFVDEIGEEKFVELRDHFQSVKNCGFSLDDIRKAPGHVFRPNDSDCDSDLD